MKTTVFGAEVEQGNKGQIVAAITNELRRIRNLGVSMDLRAENLKKVFSMCGLEFGERDHWLFVQAVTAEDYENC